MSQKHKIAVDFGTTNSVIAIWDNETNSPRLLNVPGLSQAAAQARRRGARVHSAVVELGVEHAGRLEGAHVRGELAEPGLEQVCGRGDR